MCEPETWGIQPKSARFHYPETKSSVELSCSERLKSYKSYIYIYKIVDSIESSDFVL